MIGTIVAAALWALVASLLLSVVLGALVAGAIAYARPAAATRGALWSLALAAAGFAPVAILAVMLVRGSLAEHADARALATARASSHATIPRGAQMAGVPAAAPAPLPHHHAGHLPALPDLEPLLAAGIVVVWAAGALIGLIGLGRSLVRVRGLKLRSSPLDGELATELPWLTLTPGREIYLRLSYETETPIAVGFRRPVILLPTEMATADGLTSIEPLIMHEYAHLSRYDDWSNLAQRVTERIFWFNPLVWILGRRIALEREVAADEAVVARTRDPKVYASTLWRMAQEMRMPEHVVVAPGAMLTRKQISVRIERLLDEHPAGPRYAGASALAITIVTLSGVAALAASAPPVELAQTAAPRIVPKPDPAYAAAAPRASAAPAAPPASIQAVTIPKLPPTPVIASGVVADIDDDTPLSRDLVGRCIGCTFDRRSLRGIDLSNMAITGDSFDRADLRGANFSNAKLQGLSFARADLSRSNFHGAKLTGVDLSRATLDGSDLSEATLTGVDLSHASMNGTNTRGIHLIGSSLP